MQQKETTERHCSLMRRLLAMTYDALIVIALLMVAALIALPFTGPDVRAGLDPLFSGYLLLVWFAYFGWCWRHSAATLGMRAWRVRIRTGFGSVPGWGSCALRFGVAFVSGLAAGLGFAWALFDRQRRCWHDMASDSYLIVVEKNSDRAA